MNKLSVLVFSLAVVVLSAFSTASATDLKSAWLEYENARNTMHESFALIDNSRNEVSRAWTELDNIWNQINTQWDSNDSAWASVDQQFGNIFNQYVAYIPDLSRPSIDAYRDTTRNTYPRTYFQSTPSYYEKPWTPDPTWGSWEELSSAWAHLDKAWVIANSAWAELDKAWPELAMAYAEAEAQWEHLRIAGQEVIRANNDTRYLGRNLDFQVSASRLAQGQP